MTKEAPRRRAHTAAALVKAGLVAGAAVTAVAAVRAFRRRPASLRLRRSRMCATPPAPVARRGWETRWNSSHPALQTADDVTDAQRDEGRVDKPADGRFIDDGTRRQDAQPLRTASADGHRARRMITEESFHRRAGIAPERSRPPDRPGAPRSPGRPRGRGHTRARRDDRRGPEQRRAVAPGSPRLAGALPDEPASGSARARLPRTTRGPGRSPAPTAITPSSMCPM